MKKLSRKYKEFGLSSWAIDHSTVIYVLIVLFFLLGLSSYLSVPRENFPEINSNEVFVSSAYPGNSAEDIERLITEPLEDKIKGVTNLVEIKSTSFEDFSLITVEFDDEIPNEEARLKVKDKVDEIVSAADWPVFNNSKVEPSIFEFSISEQIPILTINLSGDFSTEEMKEYGELIQDKIEEFSEIKQVDIRGVQDFEIEVALDIYKMTAMKVSFDDVINSINRENSTISAGNIVSNGLRKNLRLIGEISSPEELEQFVIKNNNGIVYLGDIADIQFKEKEINTYARSYLDKAVMLNVKKRSGTNLISLVKKIRTLVKDLKDNVLPAGLKITISNDQSNLTENLVSDLANNIVFGVILVIIVLMFFLGFRNALFVGFAIPMSMFMSFMFLGFFGFTINTMVLFGLIMGLGMLVDNGIVVVENAYRLMEKEGMSAVEAAKKGIGEIAYPIIISTLTTVAAFVPLGFWPGTIGEFMVFFPITLSVVLGSSLIVAIFFNSMLISKFMNIEDKVISDKTLWRLTFILGGIGLILIFNEGTLKGIGTIMLFANLMLWAYKYFIKKGANYFQNVMLVKLEQVYKKALSSILKGYRPIYYLVGTFLLLISSFVVLGIASPKVEFFPENEPNQIFVYIEYPEGTDIKKTNDITRKIEKRVFNIVNSDKYVVDGENFMLDSFVAQVGVGAQNPQTDKGGDQDLPHKAKITISLKEFKFRRGKSSETLRQEVQEELQNKYSGVSISVEKEASGPPAGYPINIEVSGEDYNQLIQEANRIREFLNEENIVGVEELKIDVNKNRPVLKIKVNREKAGQLGLSAGQVGRQLRRSLFGEKAGIYKYNGDDYEINVRLEEEDKYNLETLMDQYIIFRDQATGKIKEIPISSIVESHNSTSFSSIKHRKLQRVVTVYSAVLAGMNANEVVATMQQSMERLKLPRGVSYKFTGEIEKQDENMSFLLGALLTAIGLIMFLLVIQFNSISNPLIILLSILLSFTGVLYGITLFNMPFVIMMTMMGIISLAGIVVNNSVVLIDYTQLLIQRKKDDLGLGAKKYLDSHQIKEIIVEGGSARLRPVLLTAITTILGLLPLATGLNINFGTLITEWNPHIYVGGDNVIFWGPLSWTVIFGLTFATFLTLIIVPSCYAIVYSIKRRLLSK